MRVREIEVLGKLNHPNIVQLEREEIEVSEIKNKILFFSLISKRVQKQKEAIRVF